jgi:hypothetical protein
VSVGYSLAFRYGSVEFFEGPACSPPAFHGPDRERSVSSARRRDGSAYVELSISLTGIEPYAGRPKYSTYPSTSMTSNPRNLSELLPRGSRNETPREVNSSASASGSGV